jgi:hypothetical protein
MTTPISKSSRAYRAAAKAADWHAVCLIGWEGPRPAYFGDNQGIWPVRIVGTTKEMTAHEKADLETPHVGVVVLEHVLVPSAAHMKRLKDALDEVLLGEQEGQSNNALKSRWRNVRGCWDQDDPDPSTREQSRAIWWALVLEQAQRMLRQGSTEFPIYDSEQVYRMLSKQATRGH